MVWISLTFLAALGHISASELRQPIVVLIWFLAIVKSIPLNRHLQAESSASVPWVIMQVTNGECSNLRTALVTLRDGSTPRPSEQLATCVCSGLGGSGAASRAQVEILSTGFDFSSENGRCKATIALVKGLKTAKYSTLRI